MERFFKDCLGKHFKSDSNKGDLFYPYPVSPGLKPVSYPNLLENVGYKITCPIVFDRIQRFIRKRYKVRFVLSLLVLILWLGAGSIGGLMTTTTGLLIIGISTLCFCGFRIWYFFKIKSLILKGIGLSKKSTFKERLTKLPYLYFSFLSRLTISTVVFMYYVSPNISDDEKMGCFFMLGALFYFIRRYYMLYWGLKSDQSYEKTGKL